MNWLDTLMQWLHLSAAVTGVGALIYGRLVVGPSLGSLPQETRSKLVGDLTARMRPISFTVIAVLLVTGFYNYLTRLSERPPSYHMILGIKILLALHVFSVAVLLAVPPGANPTRDARRPRLMAGAAISGILVLLLSAYLRRNY
jgi:hypothetical protein